MDRPDFGAELRALYRGGREDLLNTLNGQALTREPGDPATPTQMQTNLDLGVSYEQEGPEQPDMEMEME